MKSADRPNSTATGFGRAWRDSAGALLAFASAAVLACAAEAQPAPMWPAPPAMNVPPPAMNVPPPAMNLLGVWTGTARCPQEGSRPFTITITDQTGNKVSAVLADNSPLQGSQEGDQVSLEAPWGQRWLGRIVPAERVLRMEGDTFRGAEPTGCSFELSKP
jgi:hypothetical protein